MHVNPATQLMCPNSTRRCLLLLHTCREVAIERQITDRNASCTAKHMTTLVAVHVHARAPVGPPAAPFCLASLQQVGCHARASSAAAASRASAPRRCWCLQEQQSHSNACLPAGNAALQPVSTQQLTRNHLWGDLTIFLEYRGKRLMTVAYM